MATQVQDTSGQQDVVLQTAAQHWGIPTAILKGVYGVETNFGQNDTTSSAGAKGAFQFLQSTAAHYNYPYTNDTGPATFAQQADAAAHYLSDLAKQHGGDWNAALQAYSGGGYGLAQVQAKSGGTIAGASDLTGPVGSVVNTVTSTVGSVSDLVGMVTSLSFWTRVLEIVGGLVLIAMGLRTLSGTTTTPVTVAKGAARSGAKAAKVAAL